jgi:hypothetical protein
MGGQAVSFGVASSAVLGDKENLRIVVSLFHRKVLGRQPAAD